MARKPNWFGAVFGVLWTILAIAITSSAPSDGPFVVAKVVFPLFGVFFVVASLLGMRKDRPEAERIVVVQAPPPPAPVRLQAEVDLTCPKCGDRANGDDVSPEGSAKCRSCGAWFKAVRPTAGA